MKLAEFCLSEGFKLGFNGIATFKSAENVREVIEHTPLDQMVLETDSPYLTPVPYRGKQNSPYYLPFIAKKIAEIKNIDIEILLQNTYQNSIDLFAGLNSFETGLRDENQLRKN
jgi:TatD DNase family protein